ncbi:MAG TPA: PAS domain S-box protein [Thermoleophilaceae bacterium]|nr:PAS domain S-box protein [Thermoleophilaceae bacterium]
MRGLGSRRERATRASSPARACITDALPVELMPSLLETLPEALIVVDGAGKIIVSNRRARELGAPAASMLVAEWAARSEQLYADDEGTVLTPRDLPLEEALAGTESEDRELVLLRGGSRCVYSVSATPLRDTRGNVRAAVVALHDVTSLANLGTRIRLQSAIATHIGSGIGLVRAEDGRIVYANEAWERMLRYDAGKLVGAHISQVAVLPRDEAPDHRAHEIDQTLSGGGTWKGEIRNVRQDGTSLWCAATLSALDHPEHGPVWILVQTDMTKQKAAEDALRVVEERFRGVFEHAPVGIAIVGTDMRLLNANRVLAEITGYTREELLGRSLTDLTHHDDVALDAELAAQAFGGEIERYRINKRFVTKDGDVVPVALTATYVRDLADRPLHSIAIVEPLTMGRLSALPVKRD